MGTIETALIPKDYYPPLAETGEEAAAAQPGPAGAKLPELRNNRLEKLGLGQGGQKDKEEDEWHRRVQMQVAKEFARVKQRKELRLAENTRFRSQLDAQIAERNRHQAE